MICVFLCGLLAGSILSLFAFAMVGINRDTEAFEEGFGGGFALGYEQGYDDAVYSGETMRRD